MEENDEKRLASEFIEYTDANLFLTGKAGTGKTTFLRELKENCTKNMVVLAPTGIAAINAGGMTIHSFFQLPLAPYIPESAFKGADGAKYRFHYRKERLKIIRSLDLIVIDEISMVRADLLDAMDNVLRRFRNPMKPFGGVQLLMIGDLQQLPPVAKKDDWELLKEHYDSTYFFASHALRKTAFFVIELKKVYRQTDREFIGILNSIRDNRCSAETFNRLRERYIPGFVPPEKDSYIRLTTHNAYAQQINSMELGKLPGKEYTYRAKVEGNFPEYSYPTDEVLTLKEGAQVMFVKNGTCDDVSYYNGMLGKITGISDNGISVCREGDGHPFRIRQEVWTNAKYVLDSKSKEIVEEIEGTFTQYPVKPAWAITIHKSQGLTFDKAIIDASASFSHGQTYVALSRCRSLEGIVLDSPIDQSSVICDWKVSRFLSEQKRNSPDLAVLDNMKRQFILNLLDELFGFGYLSGLAGEMRSFLESTGELGPSSVAMKYGNELSRLEGSIMKVSETFRRQYCRIVCQAKDPSSDSFLDERVRSASTYFLEQCKDLFELIKGTSYETDDKDRKRQYRELSSELKRAARLKKTLLRFASRKGMDVHGYLKTRRDTV